MIPNAKLERSNRVARFVLPIDLVESGQASKMLVFLEFVPIRVECHHYEGVYEMVGISPKFDELAPGDEFPSVYLKIEQDRETGDFISVIIEK